MIKYRNKLKEVDLNKSYKIILKPIVTEKATKLSEFNKVVFEVASKSNKNEIKGAIEKLFSVKVKAVNIIITKGKVKRFKGVPGKRNDIKKAVITLEEGNTIDISAGV
jgi:large subunit ribosomal protein L23